MSRPGLADALREALAGRWDGPPVYVVVPPTLTLETERAVLAASGLKGSFRLRVVDWNGLARGILGDARQPLAPPVSQDVWRLLVTARLRRGRSGAFLPGLERRVADTLWDALLAQPAAPASGLADLFAPAEAKLLAELLADLEPFLARLAHPAKVALRASSFVRDVKPTVFILDDPEPNPLRDILGDAVAALPEARTLSRDDLFGGAGASCPLMTGEGLTLSRAAHPLAEAWLAAARVRDLVAAGADPSGIAVTAPRIHAYAPYLRRAFLEAAVAADLLLPTKLHGGEVRLIRALLRLGRHKGAERRRTIVDIAATGLLPRVTEVVLPLRRSTARLERLIDEPGGPLAGLIAFAHGFPEVGPPREHLGHLSALLEAQGVPATVARRGDGEAWDAAMDALRAACDAMGDMPLSEAVARDLLGTALIAARPPHPIPHHAAVRVIDLEQALAAPPEHLFVLGLADRSLAVPARRGLAPISGAPADHPLRRLWRERQEWDERLADRLRAVRSRTLHLSSPIDDGAGGRTEPALLLAEAAERFPRSVDEAPSDVVRDALSRADLAAALASTIADRRRLGRPAAAEEALARHLTALGGEGEALLALAPAPPEGRLPRQVAERLFARFSASALEARAACPTKHLAKALRLEDARDPFDPTRWGERAHAVLEQVMREVMADKLPARGDALAVRAREVALAAVAADSDLLPGERSRALAELLARSLERAAREIGEDLESGSFSPVATETRFGEGRGPQVALPAPDGPVPLAGRIDRADRRQDGGLRLVDYKTGRAKIDYVRLFYGLDSQLALYALAAEALGLGRPVRLMLWPVPWSRVHVALPGAKRGRHPERPDGLDLEAEPASATLLARATAIAGDLAAEARSGVIAPRPVRLGRKLACLTCSLLPVCRAEAPDVRRLAPMTKRDVIAACQGGTP